MHSTGCYVTHTQTTTGFLNVLNLGVLQISAMEKNFSLTNHITYRICNDVTYVCKLVSAIMLLFIVMTLNGLREVHTRTHTIKVL